MNPEPRGKRRNVGPWVPDRASASGMTRTGIYPPHTHRPSQVGARGSAPHFPKCIKDQTSMRGGAARPNFVGYAQIYPTPKNRAHTSPRRTREISETSETLECAANGWCGGLRSFSEGDLKICSLGMQTARSRMGRTVLHMAPVMQDGPKRPAGTSQLRGDTRGLHAIGGTGRRGYDCSAPLRKSCSPASGKNNR